MKVGVIHTSSNNAMPLLAIADRYPDLHLVNLTDECLWEHYVDAGMVMTDECHQILADDFNKLIHCGCERIGLLCSLVKGGIEEVQKQVELPIMVYDDVMAERAVEIVPDGGKIAVIAMKTAPLPMASEAVVKAAAKAGKNIICEKIVVESAKNCLAETKDEALADQYFERYLREHQDEYSAYIIPQVPLSRIMPRIRDMRTPVFDSMETLLDTMRRKK